MKGEENLRPFDTLSEEEQRVIRQKGGIASGKARKKKKQLKDLANIILDNNIRDEQVVKNMQEKFPELNMDDITYGLILLLKQYEKAKDGDAKAFELLRDTSGQKPVEKQEVVNLDSDGYMNVNVDGDDISDE